MHTFSALFRSLTLFHSVLSLSSLGLLRRNLGTKMVVTVLKSCTILAGMTIAFLTAGQLGIKTR